MPPQTPSTYITSCEVCIGRSTWDFLQEFYQRVETAESNARKLEQNLCEAQRTAHQHHMSLVQCEISLSSSWEILNRERLNHQAAWEALLFEIGKHKETMELLERALNAASLSNQITTAANSVVCQTASRFENVMTENSPIGQNLVKSILDSERSEPRHPTVLPSLTPRSHQGGEHGGEHDQIRSISSRSLSSSTTLNTPQNVSDNAESGLSKGTKITHNGVGKLPVKKKRLRVQQNDRRSNYQNSEPEQATVLGETTPVSG